MKKIVITFSTLFALLCVACGGHPVAETKPEPIPLMEVDTTVRGLVIYYPPTDSIELRCFDRPDPAADSNVVTVSIASGSSAYEGIQSVYMSLTDEAIELGAVIFAAPTIYRAFIQDLISLNYSAYAGPNGTNPDEFLFPGTNVRVVRTPGLAGSLKLVGTFGDNLVYGCDMENDHEDIDLWWSQDDRVFKYQVKWNSGVAYHFPDQVVVGTFAAAPSALGICPCKSE